ncbi:MAG: hypothetical protein ACKOE2_13385 [Actinomycetales bacterium]
MPAPKVLPPDSELLLLAEAGMTHAQIAQHVSLTSGTRISRSAVSVALARAGYSKPGARYDEAIPWKVRSEHSNAYPARMLRLLAKARRGTALTDEDAKRLGSWLDDLTEQDLVVAYSPDAGVLYVVGDEVDDGPEGFPIRPRTIEPEELA